MGDALECVLAVVVLFMFTGAWGFVIVPALVVIGAAMGFWRLYKLELLRREAETAAAEVEAAQAELARAEADLAAAQAEHAAACREYQRLGDALRAGGWFVADTDVSMN